MSEFAKIKAEYKMALDAFNNDFGKIKSEFEEQMFKEKGSVTTDDLKKQPADFSLHYCINDAMEQCDRMMNERPSRELSLVKTKLQEARHWLTECD